jgi:lysophospholipase L1-like esterase
VVVIGDSLSTGFGTSAKDAWPNLIDSDAREDSDPLNVVNVAQNGSGYLQVGWNKSTFGSQVQQAVTPDTDLVVFFGSENDRGFDPKKLTAAMTDAYTAAKEKSPNATVLVVGPPCVLEPARGQPPGRPGRRPGCRRGNRGKVRRPHCAGLDRERR